MKVSTLSLYFPILITLNSSPEGVVAAVEGPAVLAPLTVALSVAHPPHLAVCSILRRTRPVARRPDAHILRHVTEIVGENKGSTGCDQAGRTILVPPRADPRTFVGVSCCAAPGCLAKGDDEDKSENDAVDSEGEVMA